MFSMIVVGRESVVGKYVSDNFVARLLSVEARHVEVHERILRETGMQDDTEESSFPRKLRSKPECEPNDHQQG